MRVIDGGMETSPITDLDVSVRQANSSAVGSLALNGSALNQLGCDGSLPYRVDIKPAELLESADKRIADVLSSNPELISDSGLVSVRIETTDPLGDLARYAEACVFKAEWYGDQCPEAYSREAHEEYGPYEEGSRFILLFDINNRDDDGHPKIAGVTRLVDGSISDLKTIDDLETIWGVDQADSLADIRKKIFDWSEIDDETLLRIGLQEKTWDISTLAVPKDYRSFKGGHKSGDESIYPILSHESYKFSLDHGVESWTTILVKRFFNLYAKFGGLPFRRIAEQEDREHMRVLSTPAVLHFAELESMNVHPTNPRAPKMYRKLVIAEELDYTSLAE